MQDLLSVCIITKNEKENLKRCLAALKKYPFEIVVADTGSADGTLELLEQEKDRVRVEQFAWCDDFAAAKNFAVSKASNPFVMILDSDEVLQEIDVQKLERQLKKNCGQVGRIFRKNVLEREGIRRENTEWINRIFAKDLFHYEGKIHEQVTKFSGKFYDTYQAPVVIVHTGYDLPKEKLKEKAQRNKKLLVEELKAQLLPFGEIKGKEKECQQKILEILGNGENDFLRDEQIPYLLYQIGKSDYMAENYADACESFSCALSFDLNPKLEYVIDMVETYGYALLNSGQAKEALFFENIYEEFGNSADFQLLMGLIYMNNARFEEAVSEFLKAAQQKDCRNTGANSYLAFYNVGVIYECLGHKNEAVQYYQKCGEYKKAKERLAVLK